jgi:hypothetical protein
MFVTVLVVVAAVYAILTGAESHRKGGIITRRASDSSARRGSAPRN